VSNTNRRFVATSNPAHRRIGFLHGEIGYNFLEGLQNPLGMRSPSRVTVPENHIHLLLCPPMDYLWTPWRYAYVTNVETTPGCIFCRVLIAGDDAGNRIAYRGKHCFVILNRYPYTSGHVMIVPYEHLDELEKLPVEAAHEMMGLSQKMEGVLRLLYKPDGVNLGMNIGKAAGAGVAGHIHMHVLPRWVADANFVSVIGETRVLPETLDVTWGRIKEALASRT
jgi:ATP adenylyltransferase